MHLEHSDPSSSPVLMMRSTAVEISTDVDLFSSLVEGMTRASPPSRCISKQGTRSTADAA
eukprot:6271319-Pyramimonas_sp.AAC.1